MQKNKISIKLNKSAQEIFDFTINPDNTPLWIEHLKVEETSEFPPRVGTIYRNHDGSGNWDEYEVTDLEHGKVFELTSKDGIYHVRYRYFSISKKSSEMEYYEWVDKGELTNPFKLDVLKKLKQIIEEAD
jgi:hypothetical protein